MNVNTEYENLIKLVIVGDASVGKTNFISRFIDGTFTELYMPSVAFDFKTKLLTLPNKSVVKLQIWDSIVQDKFSEIKQSLFAKMHGIILMYDITNQESFDEIPEKIKALNEINEEALIMLVANKCDCESERVVTEQDGNILAIKFNLSFAEASAKENINVIETFTKITQDVINYIHQKVIIYEKDIETDSLRETLLYKSNKKKKFCCCC